MPAKSEFSFTLESAVPCNKNTHISSLGMKTILIKVDFICKMYLLNQLFRNKVYCYIINHFEFLADKAPIISIGW